MHFDSCFHIFLVLSPTNTLNRFVLQSRCDSPKDWCVCPFISIHLCPFSELVNKIISPKALHLLKQMLIKLNAAVCSSFLRHSLTSFCLVLLGLERIPGFIKPENHSPTHTELHTTFACDADWPVGYMGREEMYVCACELYGVFKTWEWKSRWKEMKR